MTIKNTQQKVGKNFNANFEAIFGKEADREPARGSFTQDPATGGLVPRGAIEVNRVNAPLVMEPHRDFVSSIDGSIVASRQQLAEHNKRHGVTNAADYSTQFIEGRKKQREAAGQAMLKRTRVEDINRAIDMHT